MSGRSRAAAIGAVAVAVALAVALVASVVVRSGIERRIAAEIENRFGGEVTASVAVTAPLRVVAGRVGDVAVTVTDPELCGITASRLELHLDNLRTDPLEVDSIVGELWLDLNDLRQAVEASNAALAGVNVSVAGNQVVASTNGVPALRLQLAPTANDAGVRFAVAAAEVDGIPISDDALAVLAGRAPAPRPLPDGFRPIGVTVATDGVRIAFGADELAPPSRADRNC